MCRKVIGILLVLALCVALALPGSAAVASDSYRRGFADYGGYTPTKTAYTFLVEPPPIEEPEEDDPEEDDPDEDPDDEDPEEDPDDADDADADAEEDEPADAAPAHPGIGPVLVYNKEVDLYPNFRDIFLAGSDLYIPIGARASGTAGTQIATDKQIKTDNVQISYKVVTGLDYVDAVTLISGKKEKLSDLPAGMYAKIEFADTFLPLDHSTVQIRLVLSVNGVSYQRTAITFTGRLRNRVEEISRNSVYGAMLPMQFRVHPKYGGDATFDFGDGILFTARVGPEKKYYLNLDKTARQNITELNSGAYLEFYDFKGHNDTFVSTGKLELPVNRSKFKEKKTSTQLYVYEIVGDQLTSMGKDTVSYSYVANKVTISTQTLGSYVFSSRPLLRDIKDSVEWDILRTGYAEDPSDSETSVIAG